MVCFNKDHKIYIQAITYCFSLIFYYGEFQTRSRRQWVGGGSPITYFSPSPRIILPLPHHPSGHHQFILYGSVFTFRLFIFFSQIPHTSGITSYSTFHHPHYCQWQDFILDGRVDCVCMCVYTHVSLTHTSLLTCLWTRVASVSWLL